MASSSTKALRDSDFGADRHIEVDVVMDAAGNRQVVLEDMSFGTGVGWYAQKTIRLDPEQVRALMRALCTCRQVALNSHVVAPNGQDPRDASPRLADGASDAKILAFPG